MPFGALEGIRRCLSRSGRRSWPRTRRGLGEFSKLVSATQSTQSMADTAMPAPITKQPTEHFDVLIVGAGISGIGAAYHLTHQCGGRSLVVLEEQESFGGTWRTHRYPGIRSDSDLYTFGYRFKPWTGTPIATAEEILRYMGEVIVENGLAPHIRYR